MLARFTCAKESLSCEFGCSPERSGAGYLNCGPSRCNALERARAQPPELRLQNLDCLRRPPLARAPVARAAAQRGAQVESWPLSPANAPTLKTKPSKSGALVLLDCNKNDWQIFAPEPARSAPPIKRLAARRQAAARRLASLARATTWSMGSLASVNFDRAPEWSWRRRPGGASSLRSQSWPGERAPGGQVALRARWTRVTREAITLALCLSRSSAGARKWEREREPLWFASPPVLTQTHALTEQSRLIAGNASNQLGRSQPLEPTTSESSNYADDIESRPAESWRGQIVDKPLQLRVLLPCLCWFFFFFCRRRRRRHWQRVRVCPRRSSHLLSSEERASERTEHLGRPTARAARLACAI